MHIRIFIAILMLAVAAFSQTPPIEPGVSHELAKWRAARYSDVRYKLNLTLEKMSPVLKGTMEIRVKVAAGSEPGAIATGFPTPIILDWRKIRGSENLSTISSVSVNGEAKNPVAIAPGSDLISAARYEERDEHLIFRDGVVVGENIIKLDFTSPILTSGSAITRYVDKEDGAEYIYSLFVPSDASTAFPVFDQPDLKARFSLTTMLFEKNWKVVSNTGTPRRLLLECSYGKICPFGYIFPETKPISTYIFAFAVGDFDEFTEASQDQIISELDKEKRTKGDVNEKGEPFITVAEIHSRNPKIYVRKSQAAKFKAHAAEVFRLNREGIKFLESYFDYKFPFPKYDIVLIPEFPFGGMEHAGATFLRESSVIFPQEPTKNDYISRANVIFHEAAHQWFGDTVTMKWFDDLWLKEGFAEFMAYKTLEKVMPEYNAWKVFYERNKQAAYLTDSTKGTTPIYQEIANLNSAKSAYGNIVYRKAPSFLKQAEFYLGPDKFQTAVRAFLKKHEYANAGWEDLVKEFVGVSFATKKQTEFYSKLSTKEQNYYEIFESEQLKAWARNWVTSRGMPIVRMSPSLLNSRFKPDWSISVFNVGVDGIVPSEFSQMGTLGADSDWQQNVQVVKAFTNGERDTVEVHLGFRKFYGKKTEPNPYWDAPGIVQLSTDAEEKAKLESRKSLFIFPNYQDYGYGIFLLDDKSRNYVLKNIQNEKDDFLRTMMWGSLWDSVREGELDPKDYVELVVRNIKLETDESTVQTLLGRVSTAMRYYLSEPLALAGGTSVATKQAKVKPRTNSSSAVPPAYVGGSDLQNRIESLLIDRMQNASTNGQKITYYRAFLNIASSENARRIMKVILKGGNLSGSEGAQRGTPSSLGTLPTGRVSASTKDRFDIVSKLIILGDPEAPKFLADLEKTETSDEAKRYAYAAKAGFATAENKAKFWTDFVSNKDISESWIEAAFGPFNNVRHSGLTLPYLEKALAELPNLKRSRKIFFVNGWLGAFIGGQKSEAALAIVNKFLADNPNLDKDLRLKILENVDLIERAVRIRGRFGKK